MQRYCKKFIVHNIAFPCKACYLLCFTYKVSVFFRVIYVEIKIRRTILYCLRINLFITELKCLLFNSCYSWKLLALNCLEQCTTTSRDI